MSDISPEAYVTLFAEAFRQAAETVFSQTLGTPWNVQVSNDPAGDIADGWLTFQWSCTGRLTGNASISIRKENALVLGQKLLGEESDTAAHIGNEYEQAVEGFFRQVGEILQTALSEQFGQVKLQLAPNEAPASEGTVVHLFAVEGAQKIHLLLRVMPEPANVLSASKPHSDAEPQPTNEIGARINLALLLGIDLNLTLRFGRSHLTLDEILALSPGAVVEVDRQVQEPVDLLLDDRLVATADVVVVDGNYGLRINTVEI